MGKLIRCITSDGLVMATAIDSTDIVSVGAINAILGLSSAENMEKAVLMHVPKGTEELNLKALEEGANIAK